MEEYIGRGNIHHVEEVDSYVCSPFLHVVYSNVVWFSLGPLVFKWVFKFVITMKIQTLGVVPSHIAGVVVSMSHCWCCSWSIALLVLLVESLSHC
jgi:hypothetical protein